MSLNLADILYQDGDLGGGWEAGPDGDPQGLAQITNALGKSDRRLFLYGKGKGGASACVFASKEECQAAMAKMEPGLTSLVEGRTDPLRRPSHVNLLGDRAVSGVAVFSIPNMEVLGISPTSFPTILFVRGPVLVYIRCSDLSEQEVYVYARKIDSRLSAAIPRT
jgi:hypothetical protein